MANFLNFISCGINTVLDGLLIRDLTANVDFPLVSYAGIEEIKKSPTTFEILNTVIENIEEEFVTGTAGDPVQMFNILGTTNLIIRNMSIMNSNQICKLLLSRLIIISSSWSNPKI